MTAVDDARLRRIDQTLSQLDDAVKVMTANLMDLEANATRQMLEPESLTGITAVRAEQALATLGWLWSQFLRIKEIVEQAEGLRGARRRLDGPRLDELEHLVQGPSIALAPLVVPLAHRGLLTPGETPAAISPTDLIADMARAFDAARSDISAIEAAWTLGIPRLEGMTAALEAITVPATDLGEADDPDLAAAARLIRGAALVIGTDPLGQPAAGLDEAEAALSRARARLRDLAGQRDSLRDRLEDAGRLVEEVAGLVAEGEGAAEETRAKIAHPADLLRPLDAGCLDDERRGLRPWLDRLARMAAAGSWKKASRGLQEWSGVAAATRDAAQQVIDANTAPLRRRAELRGRLDALTAKAARLGLAEDAVLGAMRQQAREVLYSAPCDLERAEALVTSYGATLSRHQVATPSHQDRRPPGDRA